MGPGGGQPRTCCWWRRRRCEEAGCLAEIFAGGAAKGRGLAETYARVAGRHGAAFLDAGQAIAVSPLDGVHFDAAAHAALGRAVAAAIRDMED